MWKTTFGKFEVVWSAKAEYITSKFLNAVFHKFYLVHFWIPWPTCDPRNGFTKPTRRILTITQKSSFIMLKKYHKTAILCNIITTPFAHHICILVPMVWPAKANLNIKNVQWKKRRAKVFMIIVTHLLCFIV